MHHFATSIILIEALVGSPLPSLEHSLSFTLAVVAPEARPLEPGMFSSHFRFGNPSVLLQFRLLGFLLGLGYFLAITFPPINPELGTTEQGECSEWKTKRSRSQCHPRLSRFSAGPCLGEAGSMHGCPTASKGDSRQGLPQKAVPRPCPQPALKPPGKARLRSISQFTRVEDGGAGRKACETRSAALKHHLRRH